MRQNTNSGDRKKTPKSKQPSRKSKKIPRHMNHMKGNLSTWGQKWFRQGVPTSESSGSQCHIGEIGTNGHHASSTLPPITDSTLQSPSDPNSFRRSESSRSFDMTGTTSTSSSAHVSTLSLTISEGGGNSASFQVSHSNDTIIPRNGREERSALATSTATGQSGGYSRLPDNTPYISSSGYHIGQPAVEPNRPSDLLSPYSNFSLLTQTSNQSAYGSPNTDMGANSSFDSSFFANVMNSSISHPVMSYDHTVPLHDSSHSVNRLPAEYPVHGHVSQQEAFPDWIPAPDQMHSQLWSPPHFLQAVPHHDQRTPLEDWPPSSQQLNLRFDTTVTALHSSIPPIDQLSNPGSPYNTYHTHNRSMSGDAYSISPIHNVSPAGHYTNALPAGFSHGDNPASQSLTSQLIPPHIHSTSSSSSSTRSIYSRQSDSISMQSLSTTPSIFEIPSSPISRSASNGLDYPNTDMEYNSRFPSPLSAPYSDMSRGSPSSLSLAYVGPSDGGFYLHTETSRIFSPHDALSRS